MAEQDFKGEGGRSYDNSNDEIDLFDLFNIYWRTSGSSAP